MDERKRILFLSDHPLVPSGVGIQAKYVIESLVKSGRFKFFCFGGAIKHPDYTLQQIAPDIFGEGNWLIQPVDGHGNKDLMRRTLAEFKPHAVVIFTDPRFFTWLFEMEDEIRAVAPLVYWHVWDNDPTPEFNRPIYDACDFIMPLSLKTYGILQGLGYPPDRFAYVPHAEPDDLFHPLSEREIFEARHQHFGPFADREFIVFWNNRNARRKMPGDVVDSFRRLCDRIGRDKCALIMHTSPTDPEGQDLHALVKKFDVESSFMLSNNRISPEQMNMLYNCSDVTLQLACFPAGTKVTAKSGFKDIETIEIGDDVLTHKGRFKKVIKTMKRDYTGNVRKIKATNVSELIATNEHPFFAVKGADVDFLINEDDNVKRLVSMANWIPASKLDIGDYLLHTNENVQSVNHVFDVWSTVKDELTDTTGKNRFELVEDKICSTNGNGKLSSRSKIPLDEDLAYILGEWIADGTTGTCDVAFNLDDNENLEFLRKKYTRVFGEETYISERPESNVMLLRMRKSAVYSLWMTKICGSYSHGKRAPRAIITATDDIKRAFIAGYLAGDGCVLTHPSHGTKTNRIRTVSDSMAADFQQILSSLGYCPSVRIEDNSHGYKKNSKIWVIEWRDRKRTNNGSCRSWNFGDGFITRIFDIEDEHVKGLVVYNFEVEDDNSYQVFGIDCHNCNEGFGLSSLESLFAGTPICVNMTGGLQFQIGDWYEDLKDFSDQTKLTKISRDRKNTHRWWGEPIYPAARNCVGSQACPYIYDDRVNDDDVARALERMSRLGRKRLKQLGAEAREWAKERFSMKRLQDSWTKVLDTMIERHAKMADERGLPRLAVV